MDPPPEADDREARDRWTARGLLWARAVDPEGAERALAAVLDQAEAEGWIAKSGATEDGQVWYRSLTYRPKRRRSEHQRESSRQRGSR
jgi:hypothetical protein